MADNNKKHIIVCGKGGGGSGTQVQADWNETDSTSPAYINNKPTNVSDFTNDAGYITNADVLAYKAFPTGWHTTGTMADLISDINSDSNAVVGMSYMDTVSFSDLPTGMQQGEIQVDVVSEQTGLGKVLNFTLKSSNLSPYHWEYTSAYGAAGTWRQWALNTDIPTNTSDLNNDSGFITISDVPAQQQADWNEVDSASPAYIENKPTIPAAQVNSDWNANSGVAQILNKPTIPVLPPMATETLTFTLADQSTVTLMVYVKPEPFYIKDVSGTTNTLSITKSGSTAPSIEVFYSTDTENWTSMGTTSTTAITATIPANGKLYLKANTNSWGAQFEGNTITASGSFNVGGNIMSLLNGDNYINTSISESYSFTKLFKASTNLIDSSELVLPNNTTTMCYQYMFQNCTSLTAAPVLPATTVGNNSYNSMFSGCTSLTAAPALPATSLTTRSYSQMFSGCTSLTTAPVLPATALDARSYESMFNGCTNLNTVITYANSAHWMYPPAENWLANVSSTGDFYALGTYNWTTNSPSGIPSGWTKHTSL